MKKILITGFDPFGGESTNPALAAVMALPDKIGDLVVIKRELPTVFGKSIDLLYNFLDSEAPDAVICVGQAGGRPNITVERVAINCNDSSMPDNAGNAPADQPIEPAGAAAYFATLPIKLIVDKLREGGIPAGISNSAGTYVCNQIMYGALHYAATHRPGMAAGFVHIPYLPSQVIDKPAAPSMPLDMLVLALQIIIKASAGM